MTAKDPQSAARPSSSRVRKWGFWIVLALVLLTAFEAVSRFESRLAELETKIDWATAELFSVRQATEEAKSAADEAQDTADEIRSALPASLE